MKTCAGCHYFDRVSTLRPHEQRDIDSGSVEAGYCRRAGPVCGGTSEYTYTTWPVVFINEWCGEWDNREQQRNHCNRPPNVGGR